MTDSALDLSQLLREQRDRIVSLFVTEVQRTALPPLGVSRSMLTDDIPTFLDEIADELDRLPGARTSQEVVDTSAPARQHGEQRWGLGYDLEALLREYGVLRHCIVQTAKEAGVRISLDEFDVLAKCLSVGVAEAATEYIKYRDEELNAQKANLVFLAEAGQLLSSSLDYRSTLSRLTALIVPRLADCCAIHIEGSGIDELPVAHVDPAKAEIVREIYRRFPLPPETAYVWPELHRSKDAQVMGDITPELLEDIAQSPEHLELLRQLNVCSWMVVPLRVQNHVFGALGLTYSDSRRRYTDQDLLLATELANRAAVAIDNARLYDLSQQERSKVEAALRAKDEFVAVVSHELRTPLMSILGWVRLLRSSKLDESKKARAFEIIERNADAQNRLVADLLDISRSITGLLRINPSQLNLCDVIDITVEGVRPAADAKRIRIEVELDREHGVLRGDPDRLQQVVWNLLVNAVKFTPKGGAVRVTLRRVESDLELTVADNGIGIEPNFLPHVFEAFRQAEASLSRSHGGLGLGLSIVKQIVELHGGSIAARSTGNGQGATFVVRLPVSPLISTALGVSRVPVTAAEGSHRQLPSGLTGISVLVVEDEPDARELLAYVLESCGMEVRLAASAAEAMQELERFAPTVILSDIGMAREDGYSLIRQIRTHTSEQKRGIPAIALTAFARNEDRTRALTAGFNLHMAKPVEPSALVDAVLELAGVSRR
jgi:signal transduction histidine kinase/CheY-like chemotaxis protein